MEKRYDRIEEFEKSFDHIEEVQKFNPYHDSRGRFTTGGGGGIGGPSMAPDGKGGAGGGAKGDIKSRADATWAKLEPLEDEYNSLGKEWDNAREAWRKANKAKDSDGRNEAKQRMDAITDKMNKIEPKIRKLRNQWDKIEREAYEAGVTLA